MKKPNGAVNEKTLSAIPDDLTRTGPLAVMSLFSLVNEKTGNANSVNIVFHFLPGPARRLPLGLAHTVRAARGSATPSVSSAIAIVNPTIASWSEAEAPRMPAPRRAVARAARTAQARAAAVAASTSGAWADAMALLLPPLSGCWR